ncbi:MAG: hypothetical protein K0S47_4472, partial [Herbinix sp.]|nr:hypothetical protein [Herbinix sp.]
MGKYIILDIINAVWDYGWYSLILAAIIIGSILCIISILKLTKGCSVKTYIWHHRYSFLLGYVFCAYIFLVVSITLLSRPRGSRVGIDLIPFSTFSPNLLGSRYPIENILLFIPFGFLLPSLWEPFRKIYLCLGTGLVFSIGIESIQLITKRGFFQLDDMVTNILGAFIGFTAN